MFLNTGEACTESLLLAIIIIMQKPEDKYYGSTMPMNVTFVSVLMGKLIVSV